MLRPFVQADSDRLSYAKQLSFGASAADIQGWWEKAGHDCLRVWESHGRVIGGLVDIPMGLFVGSGRVSNHGVAGVTIAPEHRGRGQGKAMMAAYVQELHAEQVAVSTLYASTRSLYRGVGYGVAGTRFFAELDTRLLRGAGRRASGWREATEADRERIMVVRPDWVRASTGQCHRGPYLWDRVWAHRGTPNRVFVLEDDEGELRAWLTYRLSRGADDFLTLDLADYGARDHESLSAIVGMLGVQTSMVRTLKFACGPNDVLLDALPEHVASLTLYEPWLLRVTHLQRALEDRGWPVGLQLRLDLHLDDPVVSEQSGDWVVEIARSKASVQRGGTGAIRLGPRGLAALYTGYTTPHDLVLRGLLDAGGQDRARLSAAFSGPPPGMSDGF